MLDIEKFDIKLGTEFIGRNFVLVDEIESTNSYLLKNSNKSLKNGTVLFAEKQIKGKGRQERTWYSQKGQNLTFSILLTDKKYFGKTFNLINFGTAVTIAQSLENLYMLKTETKWPNDILVNHKKISGILFESVSQGSKIDRLVIGIGINVNQNQFQGEFKIAPTSIRTEIDNIVEREKLLAEILTHFEVMLERVWRNPQGVLNDWKSRCRMIGEKISLDDGNKIRYGFFDDLDENGYLIFRYKNKTEKIHFGDVTLA